MRTILTALAALTLVTPASAQAPEGTWLVDHKAAVRLFDCDGALCGSVVWMRNPALRTAEVCNRTIIWGLQSAGAGEWNDGSFYNPEDGDTYHVELTQDSEETLSAKVYQGVSWLSETVSLIRIAPYSLSGWCG